MSSPDRARILAETGALRDAVAELRRSLDHIEERLALVERQELVDAVPDLPSVQSSVQRPLPPPLPPPRVAQVPAPPPAPAAATENPHLETRMGLTLVNRIGVITLIIGVALFFKYAIDNQWIGETGRVVLGILAGLASVFAGDMLWRRGQKIFAQGICGLGVAILYLSFYASFSFYHLLPQAAAFVLMALVTVLTGVLAFRYNSMAIAVLGMAGGYGTPLLLSTGQDAPWTFFSYVFLISLGAVVIARARHWRALELLGFLATVILWVSWFGEWFRPEKQVVATFAALAFFLLFAFVDWPVLFFAMQALTALALALIWKEPAPYFLLSLGVGAAGLLAAETNVAGLARRPTAAAVSFAAFWGAYVIWSGARSDLLATAQHNVTVFLWLSLAFAIYALWPPMQLVLRPAPLSTPWLTVMALNGAAYFAASDGLLERHHHAWLGLLAVALAGVHGSIAALLWEKHLDARAMRLALGLALAFLTLAAPIQFTGYSITVSWAIEAAALMWISRDGPDGRLMRGALAVYALVLIRLCTVDLGALASHHPILINVRFIAFAVSAISFWLGAFARKREPVAAALYVFGHAAFLGACLLEFNDWARALDFENRASVMAMGVSILMALYAVTLVAIGVVYRSPLNRVMGLVLIGLVVLKLYLYDVWEASKLFRTAAFVGLGVLLLLTSYLYSHFRPAIEGLLKQKRSEEAQ